MKAYAWQSGLIELGRKVPSGALLIAEGPARPLRDVVGALARHGYGASEGKMLVPGVPEASLLKTDPVKSLEKFSTWVRASLQRRIARPS